jgi:hypothetical protein
MPLTTVVVATDQPQGTAKQRRQCRQLLPQAAGETQAVVDQITEHDHLLRSPLVGKLQQSIKGLGVAVTGQGNAVSLETFGLAQMQICQ